jgi:hypothetical protein
LQAPPEIKQFSAAAAAHKRHCHQSQGNGGDFPEACIANGIRQLPLAGPWQQSLEKSLVKTQCNRFDSLS